MRLSLRPPGLALKRSIRRRLRRTCANALCDDDHYRTFGTQLVDFSRVTYEQFETGCSSLHVLELWPVLQVASHERLKPTRRPESSCPPLSGFVWPDAIVNFRRQHESINVESDVTLATYVGLHAVVQFLRI